MTEGIKLMKELGFVETTEKRASKSVYEIVRQFIKYDDKGYITDIINYFYNKHTGVEVYTNSLKYQCGTRLDNDILNAVSINFYELEKLLKDNKLNQEDA